MELPIHFRSIQGRCRMNQHDPSDPIDERRFKNRFFFLRKNPISGLAALLILSLIVSPAHAWLRVWIEDAEQIKQSELIVVGRLEEESIKYVPVGGLRVHHAILIVTETLKGKQENAELPIIIHYGLDPVVGGRIRYESLNKDYPKGIVEIIDTGSSAVGGPPICADARKDHIWFLNRRSGAYGREPGTGDYGIVEPQVVQAISLKDYFLAYLSDDPEQAVKEQLAKNPAIEQRAKRYLDHREVQRILELKDPKQRVEKLP